MSRANFFCLSVFSVAFKSVYLSEYQSFLKKCCGQSSACLPSFYLYFTVSHSVCLSTFLTVYPCASSAKCKRSLKAGSQSICPATFPTAYPFLCKIKVGVKIFACQVSIYPSYNLSFSLSRINSKMWVNLFACLPSWLPVLASVQKLIFLSEYLLRIRDSLPLHRFPVYSNWVSIIYMLQPAFFQYSKYVRALKSALCSLHCQTEYSLVLQQIFLLAFSIKLFLFYLLPKNLREGEKNVALKNCVESLDN